LGNKRQSVKLDEQCVFDSISNINHGSKPSQASSISVARAKATAQKAVLEPEDHFDNASCNF